MGTGKGTQTAERILEIAQRLFSQQGYKGTSLRQIATEAGLQEPGLYNHFSSKQGLYEAAVINSLAPLRNMLTDQLASASDLQDYTGLPAIVTDYFAEHPAAAALLLNTLHRSEHTTPIAWMESWREELLGATSTPFEQAYGAEQNNAPLRAINMIALLNVTAGYFVSSYAFTSMTGDSSLSPENIERQKQLLHRIMRAILIS
jgi:AcrR family transcriptional regulator